MHDGTAKRQVHIFHCVGFIGEKLFLEENYFSPKIKTPFDAFVQHVHHLARFAVEGTCSDLLNSGRAINGGIDSPAGGSVIAE